MLCKVFLTITKRSLYHDARVLSIIRNSSLLDRRVLNSDTNSLCIRPDSNLCLIKRFKRSKKKQEVSDDEDDEVDDMKITESDFESDIPGSKLMQFKTRSARFTTILAIGLNISRTKAVKAFYESKIRINGKKVLKKSVQVKEGDEIDLVSGQYVENPKLLYVHRVAVLAQTPLGDKNSYKILVDRSLIIENYDDPWAKTKE